MTQSTSSKEARRSPMIVGTAMLTIVVSSKIAKKPTQITASASHGLVSRATRSIETVGAAAPAMELTSLAIGDHLLVHGHVPEVVLRLVACLRGVWESQGGTTTAWLQSAHLLVLDLPHDSISVSRKCQLDIPKFQPRTVHRGWGQGREPWRAAVGLHRSALHQRLRFAPFVGRRHRDRARVP